MGLDRMTEVVERIALLVCVERRRRRRRRERERNSEWEGGSSRC
jgi:hypothetical protein